MNSILVQTTLACCLILGEMNLLLAIKDKIVPAVLEMYEISIQSNIDNRYARTTVVKKLENKGEIGQRVTYSVVFPEEAFVSSFILEVGGKNYTAYLTGRTKDESEQDSTAISTELKGITERDSNRFSLQFSVKPALKIAFYLTYEQLLQRQNSRYEHVINLQTDQPIPHFNIQVQVAEKSSLISLNATTRICKEITCVDIPVSSNEISKLSNGKVNIQPDLSLQRQNRFQHLSQNSGGQGFIGQFVVQYDVERSTTSGQILTNNGYCLHFFAPGNLPSIPKYVVFILDTSLSMRHERLDLLKNAMDHILEKLHDKDLFNIVEFNAVVKAWQLDKTVTYYPSKTISEPIPDADLKNFNFPKAYKANTENINKAKSIISDFKATGVTDMYNALKVGLHMVDLAQNQLNNARPVIVFLTDGEPTIQNGITKEVILEQITNFNVDARKSFIYTLAFGAEPDYDFLETLAKRNGGFSKRIYDGSDASKQLQEFYELISSPVLTNVSFQYDTLTQGTRTTFPTVFNGTELVVAGKCEDVSPHVTINGQGANGMMTFTNPAVQQTEADIKRTHAFISITQQLENATLEKEEKKQIEYLKKAHDLAMANSFSTYVTSMVVRTPDGTTVVNNNRRKRGVVDVSLPNYTPPPFDDPLTSTTSVDKVQSKGSWSSLSRFLQTYILFIIFNDILHFIII